MMSYTYIGLGAAIVGGALLWIDRRVIWDGWRSRRWVSVRATIVASENTSFETYSLGNSGGSRLARFPECGRVYEYEWEGNVYRGTNYCFGGHVDQPVDGMAASHQFKVFCNPKSPAESVIKPGFGLFVYLELVLLIGGLTVALLP